MCPTSAPTGRHPPSLLPRCVPSPRDSQASSSCCCFLFVPYVLCLLIHHLTVSAPAFISYPFFLKKRNALRIASAVCLLPFAHGRVHVTPSTRPAALLLHEHHPLCSIMERSTRRDQTVLASVQQMLQRTTYRLQESYRTLVLISHAQGITRTRAVILTLSHLEKLEQRYETFGVMCQPGLVFAGSDYTGLTSQSRSTAIPPSAGLRTRL